MRISGNEPSSVILLQTFGFKSRKCWPESAKTSFSQKGWCNKPTKLKFQSKFQFKLLHITFKEYSSGKITLLDREN